MRTAYGPPKAGPKGTTLILRSICGHRRNEDVCLPESYVATSCSFHQCLLQLRCWRRRAGTPMNIIKVLLF